jgi:hypothetical protein
MSWRGALLGTLAAVFAHVPSMAATWIVDQQGGGDFTTIQAGIQGAASNDEIVVHPGIYFENINFLGKDVQVRGSAGAEATVIDGSAGPTGHGSCVSFVSGETAAALLDGFTLTGGRGSFYRGLIENDVEDVLAGGGIYTNGASPTVRNCVIADNTAEYAAGMLVSSGHPQVLHCDFDRNAAGSYGGGIAGPGSAPLIQDCSFTENSAGYGAAAIHLFLPARIERCLFRDNRAYIAAAVNASEAGADLQILDCVFIGNTAHGSDGAAVRIHEASATIEHCLFIDNSAAGTGGGVFALDEGRTTVSDCTFFGNAAAYGGNLAVHRAELVVRNCISAAATAGNGLYCYLSTVSVQCSDAWANVPQNYDGTPNPTGTDGNIAEDPLFCDPQAGDFTLRADSPCAPDGNPDCGLIGRDGVGCEATPVAAASWGAIKAMYR